MTYIRITSTGPADTMHYHRMGLYQKTAQTAQSFPVYKKVGSNEYLFVSPGGSWRVGPDPSTWSGTGLKCPGRSPTPPEPPSDGWQFYDDDGWHDDATIQVQPAGTINHTLNNFTDEKIIKMFDN